MLAKICALAGLAVASAFAPAALPGRVTSRGDIRVLCLDKIAPAELASCRFSIRDLDEMNLWDCVASIHFGKCKQYIS